MMRKAVLLLAGLVIVALAACGGEGDAPAAPTSTPSPAAIPSPSPTASPSPSPTPEVIAGIPVVPLKVAGEAEFPDDVALIVETGCWQCDGPTTGLERVYRDPSGELAVETLISPEHLGLPPRVVQTVKGTEQDEATITGFALTPEGGRIAVSVCTRGMCLEIGAPPSADAETTLFESTDGGTTWKTLDVLDGGFGVRAITGDRLLITDFATPFEDDGARYEYHPGGETVQPPVGTVTWRPFLAPSGDLLWGTKDGRILRTDGSEFLAFDLPSSAEIMDFLMQPQPAPLTTVVWYYDGDEPGPGSYYLGLVQPEGRLSKVYRLPGFGHLGGWLGVLVCGNSDVVPEQLPVPPPGPFLGYLPAVFDLKEGIASPIVDPFLERQSRNQIQAALEGPFARVVGTGSCLNVREEAGLAAAILDCAADGVLLRDLQDIVFEGDLAWVHIITPSGRSGWAAADHLER